MASQDTNALGQRLQRLSAEKLASTALQFREYVAIGASAPIAVIGLDCRVPGASSPARFWQLLRDGGDAISEIPAERRRFDRHGYLDSPEVPPFGGFLDRIDEFDAELFGIAPREVASLDPQQRMLLQQCWTAFERAGIIPEQLEGSRTGVFVGMCWADYAQLLSQRAPRYIDAYMGSGSLRSVASGRISYVFGLQGPSVTVDTACSSSLVAVHQACRSLRLGESDLAIAAGINLLLLPQFTRNFAQAKMLSIDGRCKTFDARANGYVRSEGGGVVLLKRLADAIAARDPILAVVRGTASNQDGKTSALTVPNGESQKRVIRAALDNARLGPERISYIEAHGTGTSLGDPIEANSLRQIFGDNESPVWVGSVKSNIGHLESAAGIAGLIKTILVLHHGWIPELVHFEQLNPHIEWRGSAMRTPGKGVAWPRNGATRCAGVSSFGFAGTNAHVIVEEAPRLPEDGSSPSGPYVLPLSARDADRARAMAQTYASILRRHGEDAGAISRTAACQRSRFRHRFAVTGESAESLVQALETLEITAEMPARRAGKLAFLFPGQGAQQVGMGLALYAREPRFRDAIDRCAAALEGLIPYLLTDILSGERGDIHDTALCQPALFSFEWALAEYLSHLGVVPDVMLGHSLGELVAATRAGVMTLDDALALVAERGRLMGAAPGQGSMLVAFAPWDEIAEHVPESLSIAAYNGPTNTVVSGPERDIAACADALARAKVMCRRLSVSHGFHSALMDPVRVGFERAVRRCRLAPGTIPVIANVTGHIAGELHRSPTYWCDQIRQPVRFTQGLDTLVELGCTAFLEVGPSAQLSKLGRRARAQRQSSRDSRDSRDLAWITCRPDDLAEAEGLAAGLAGLHRAGWDIDWSTYYGGPATAHPETPTYPFKPTRFWFRGNDAAADRISTHWTGAGGKAAHPLLGAELPCASSQSLYCNQRVPGYYDQHRVAGRALFPGAAYLEMMLAAGRRAFGDEPLVLRDVAFMRPMHLEDSEEGAEAGLIQLVDDPQPDRGVRDMAVYSQRQTDGSVDDPAPSGAASNPWTLHARARVLRLSPSSAASGPRIARISGPDEADARPRAITSEDLYSAYSARRIEYGPEFRPVCDVELRGSSATGHLALPRALTAPPGRKSALYRLHPVLLDGAFQVALAIAREDDDGVAALPVALDELHFYRPAPAELRVRARAKNAGTSGLVRKFDIDLETSSGELVAALRGFAVKSVPAGALTSALGMGSPRRWQEHAYERLHVASERPDPGPASPARAAANALEIDSQALALAAEPILRELPDQRAIASALAARCHEFIDRALADFGGSDPDARPRSSHHAAQLRRLRAHVVARRAREPARHDPGESLMPDDAVDLPEVAIVERCGPHLADVWRGQKSAIELLFGDDQLAGRLYRDSSGFAIMNAGLARAVGKLASAVQSAAGRGLRVLEVGAGTGATTRQVLSRIAGRCERYVFSDVSPGFLAAARAELGHHAFLEYHLLDIERGDAAPAQWRACFDVVIAANVVHACADVRQVSRILARFLSSHGHLILLEGTEAPSWADMSFGMLPGWWKFSDIRGDHPLLGADGWRSVLLESDFDTVVIPRADAGRILFPQAVIIARRRATTETASAGAPLADAGPWLLCHGGDQALTALDASLRARAARVFGASPGQARAVMAERTEADTPRIVVWSPGPDESHGRGDEGEAGEFANDPARRATALTEQLVADLRALVCEDRDSAHSSALTALVLVTRHGLPCPPASTKRLAHSALAGVMRTLALEVPELRLLHIDLDHPRPGDCQRILDELDDLLGAAPAIEADSPRDCEVVYRGNQRFVARLVPAGSLEAKNWPKKGPLYLRKKPGDVGVEWHPHPDSGGTSAVDDGGSLLAADAVEIDVAFVGLNFVDVLDRLGQLPFARRGLGMECTGVIRRAGDGVDELRPGQRVLAVTDGAFAERLVVPANRVMVVPDGLDLLAATTVPVAFMTAYECLVRVAELGAGQRVLVHAAAGGTGMAAVQIARALGADVLATASEPKWSDVRALGVAALATSRSAEFAATFAEFRGQVDVVLNVLSAELARESLPLLRPGGCFIEIAKNGILDQDEIARLRPDIRYIAVDLYRAIHEQPRIVRDALGWVLPRMSGESDVPVLSPLPVTAFEWHQAEAAFRHMERARHIGKIAVQTRGRDTHAERPIDPTTAYLITGGLRGLGLLAAQWLVERGARYLLLVARSQPDEPAREAVDRLRRSGVTVLTLAVDLGHPSAQEALGAALAEAPPLRGIIHSAGTLANARLLHMDSDKIRRVFGPKVAGTWLLDRITRKSSLDFFICFSSVTGMWGAAGQANHAAANCFMDAMMQARRCDGRTGVSVQWGAWGEVGAAVRESALETLQRKGILTMTPAIGMNAFHHLISTTRAQLAIAEMDWSRFLDQRPLTGFLARLTEPRSSIRAPDQSESLIDIRAVPVAERGLAVRNRLRRELQRVLGLAEATHIASDVGFFDIGMDSLTSVEFRNYLQAALGISLPTTTAFDYPNLDELQAFVLSELEEQGSDVVTPSAFVHVTQNETSDSALDDMSEAELATMLAARLADTGDGHG